MEEKRDNTRSAVFMGWVLTIFLNVIFLGYGTSDFPDFSWPTILILTPINFIAVCLTYLLLFYDGSKIEITDCPYCGSKNLHYVGVIMETGRRITLKQKVWKCIDCQKPIKKRYWDADSIIMTVITVSCLLLIFGWIVFTIYDVITTI
jgi:hypothetical protein